MRWRRWRCCAVGREYEEVAPVSHIFFGKKMRRRRNANRCQEFPSFFFVSRIKKSKLLAIQSEKKGGKECQIAAKATFRIFLLCMHTRRRKSGEIGVWAKKHTYANPHPRAGAPLLPHPPVLFARNPYLTLLSKGASLRCRPRRRQRFFAHCHPRSVFFANHGFRTLHHGRRKFLDKKIIFYLDWSSEAKKKPLFSPKLH